MLKIHIRDNKIITHNSAKTHHFPSICIVCEHLPHLQAATDLAKEEGYIVFHEKQPHYDLQLCYLESRIELYSNVLNSSISVDFCSGTLAHRHKYGGGRGQAIARAVGLKQGNKPVVLDATAGLASDAFVLATLGCPVNMVERSAILTVLINDAIRRASSELSLATIFQQGFRLHHQDAVDYIRQLPETHRPDVIYLDPMYPERKKSARVKKSMQILQQLHGIENNDKDLLRYSLECAKKRVVVKRPIHAPSLNNQSPSVSIKSKKTRFDVYTINKM